MECPVVSGVRYPALQHESPEFLASITEFVAQIWQLSAAHKRNLAVLKALELMNAIVQLREQHEAHNRLGPEGARASSQPVRSVMRDRGVVLAAGERISLKDAPVREIVDVGSRLFHTGKRDRQSTSWTEFMALSTVFYIALNTDLDRELPRVWDRFQTISPKDGRQAVWENFIEPYR